MAPQVRAHLGRSLALALIHCRTLLLMLLPVVERSARSAERLIAQLAMFMVRIAESSVTVGAECLLPNPARVLAHHRLTLVTVPSTLELRHVLDNSIHAPLTR